MDLWQLKIFTKVVDTKSFSKASSLINLSQPTVSSHIKELEDHFGCRLIDRLGKESIPTKAGEILYTFARKLLDLQNQTELAIHDFLGNVKGNLVIGGSTIPSGFIIPKLIGPFKQKFPGISISLVTGDTTQIVDNIISGEIEIGLVGARMEHPHVFQEQLIKDEMRVVLPADHKWANRKFIDCKMLFKLPFIAREKGSGTWRCISETLFKAGYGTENLNVTVTFGSTASVVQGILNHVGVSILSTIAVQDDIRQGRLIALPVKDLDLTRFFYLTTHSRRTQSPVCREFISFARQCYQ